MMVHDNMQFHNVAELETRGAVPGVMLPRYPRDVRAQMNLGARVNTKKALGSEIRFVMHEDYFAIDLMALEGAGKAYLYYGDFLEREISLEAERTQTIVIRRLAGGKQKMAAVAEAHADPSLVFDPNVVRIVLDLVPIVYLGCDCPDRVRPPKEDELPDLCLMAYGSSITHAHHHGYIYHAAHRLGVDLMNMGMGGSCHAEAAAAEFLAGQTDWDLMTMELGINMHKSFTVEEFTERTSYLINRVVDRNPGKPLAVIDIFTNGPDWTPGKAQDVQKGFREALDKIVESMGRVHVIRISGRDVLSDVRGLRTDMCHPTNFGHALMGENLARMLKPICDNLRKSEVMG